MDDSDFTVAGFSAGAQQAMGFALHCDTRIDRLVLLSPAFFNSLNDTQCSAQLESYAKNPALYLRQFYRHCLHPLKRFDLAPYQSQPSREALEKLLTYQWKTDDITQLTQRKITIEIHLGAQDKIIPAEAALEFFQPLVRVFWHNDLGHLLLE